MAGTQPGYGINYSHGVTNLGDMIVGYCSFDGSPYWTTGFVWTQATGTIDVVQWLANNGVAVDAGFGIQGLSGITPDGRWIIGYGRDLIAPYTTRGFRIHNTEVGGVGPAQSGRGLALAAPAPNPSSGAARIDWTLPAAGNADLAIFDTAGRRVAMLASGWMPSGQHSATWDGRADGGQSVAAGLYWARLSTDQGSVTRRLVRMR